MGRNRGNRNDERLPKYVYRGRSAYEYVPYQSGQKRKRFRLCDLNSSTLQIWHAYEELQKNHHCVQENTLEAMSLKYLASDQFKQKEPKTKKGYEACHSTITEKKTAHGELFGTIPIKIITAGTIRSYLDTRAKVAGNREISYLSVVFSWAYERDLVEFNPVSGVKKNKETPRDRYVTNDEYWMFYELAESPWYIRPMMEMAYLCRMRRIEIRGITEKDYCLKD